MFIPRIYMPLPLMLGEELIFDTTRTHYLLNVLRVKENELVILFNGQGGEYVATIHPQKKSVKAKIIDFKNKNLRSPLALHLAQGISRGDRMDFAIQKATELGVASITPLMSAQSALKLAEATSEKRVSHWQQIAISASEQCGRTDVPIIHPALSLAEWAKRTFEGISLVFDAKCQRPLTQLNKSNTIRLAIGPESGFKQAEVDFMIENHFVACHLGPRVLRTETAGIVALSILQSAFGDLG